MYGVGPVLKEGLEEVSLWEVKLWVENVLFLLLRVSPFH